MMTLAEPVDGVVHARAAKNSYMGVGAAALRMMLSLALISVTVLPRFGLNFGAYSLNASLIAIYLLLGTAGVFGCLAFSTKRLFLYLASIACACASYWINHSFSHSDRSSFPSLLLLGLIYLPFVFTLRTGALGEDANGAMIRRFVGIAWFCALAGIAQFYAQFFIHAEWLFDFASLIPPVLRGPSGFNTVIRVGSLYKSNGFFFHEPSEFSFMMALALLAEWSCSRRLWRIAGFGLALLLTYSGTGLLTLCIGMLFPLGRKTLPRIAILGSLGFVVIWVLGDALNLSFTLQRVGEFGSERSSAYIRYIAPWRLLGDTLGAEAWTPWFGHGPGTISREIQAYEFHDPTWAKLLFEYGVLGFSLVVSLFVVALRGSGTPSRIRAVLFLCWLIMGGYLMTPEPTVLVLVLIGLWPVAGQRAVARLERTNFGPSCGGPVLHSDAAPS